MRSLSHKFFLRQDAIKKNGRYPVYLSVTINRRTKYYSCFVDSTIEQWDSGKKRVKKTHPEHYQVNTRLCSFENKVNSVKTDCFQKGIQIDIDGFDKLFNSNNKNSNSFIDHAAKFIERSAMNGTSKNTIKTYKTDLTNLSRFKEQISFDDIGIPFFEAYRSHMLNHLNNNENTIQRAFKFMRTVWNDAIRLDLVKDYPFKNWKIKNIVGNRNPLDEGQLNVLKNLYLEGSLKPSLQNVLKIFLFSCYTGLRYSDVKRLRYENINSDNSRGKTVRYLSIKLQKSSKPIEVPLADFADNLIGASPEILEVFVFRVPSNQVTNRMLKEIQLVAGIQKQMNFHVARHTCATILLNNDVAIETVSQILGHSDLKTTMIYAKVLRNRKIEAISRLNNL